MEKYPDNDVPVLTLTPNDLDVLANIITGYIAYLHRGMLPSKKRDARIQVLQRLQARLKGIAQSHLEGTIMPLSAEEMQALDNALSGFIVLIRRIVPESKEREETLQSVETLRQLLATKLT